MKDKRKRGVGRKKKGEKIERAVKRKEKKEKGEKQRSTYRE